MRELIWHSHKWKSHKASSIIDSLSLEVAGLLRNDCSLRHLSEREALTAAAAAQFPQDILSRRNEETRRKEGALRV